jgi:hypothetical protein
MKAGFSEHQESSASLCAVRSGHCDRHAASQLLVENLQQARLPDGVFDRLVSSRLYSA